MSKIILKINDMCGSGDTIGRENSVMRLNYHVSYTRSYLTKTKVPLDLNQKEQNRSV